MMTAMRESERGGVLVAVLLWLLAVLTAVSAFFYQRLTGPTYPLRGTIEVEGEEHRYALVRSEETVRDAKVTLPAAGGGVTAMLHWRRYPTGDPWRQSPLVPGTDEDGDPALVAGLPAQPAAGKLEYFLVVTTPGGAVRIPEEGEENVIIRFKDPVPNSILIPHIICMMLAILIGMRAGLAAIFQPKGMRGLVWCALGFMTVGGLVLGPIVQKYAFGHYWTGFPYGRDLTDNKLLILWAVWVVAALALGRRPKANETPGRVVVAVAAVAMTVVYLIPHSMRGSELDYSKLENVEDPKHAIGTGK